MLIQCDKGHLACNLCCDLIRKICPSCSLPIGFVRSKVIERVVKHATTSCRNRHFGCKAEVSFVKKCDHEKTCKYAPISCPLHDCAYADMPELLYIHFQKEHPTASQKFRFDKAELIFISKDQERFFLQERDEGILFVLNRFSDPRGSLVNVTCVAPTTSDMKIFYELTAIAGERSITVKTLVELTTELITQPPGEDCLLITNAFHDGDSGSSSSNSALLITVLGLKLTLKKLSH